MAFGINNNKSNLNQSKDYNYVLYGLGFASKM